MCRVAHGIQSAWTSNWTFLSHRCYKWWCTDGCSTNLAQIHRSLIWLERIYISMNPVKTTWGELRFSYLIGFRSVRTSTLVNPRALRSRSTDVFIVLRAVTWTFASGYWSHIATHLIIVLLVVGATSSKKPKAPSFQMDRDEIWQNCSSNKYASIGGVGFLIMTIMTTHFQDGGHDFISVRKVLPSSECTMHMQRLPGARCVRRLPDSNTLVLVGFLMSNWCVI